MAESRYPMTRGTTGMPGFFGDWDQFMRRFGFPSFFERTLSMGAIAPVDVCERDNEFIVRMACAGCRPQDIDITVEDDVLRIRGKFPTHEEMMAGTTRGTTQGMQQGTQQGTQPTGPTETCMIRELPTGRFERDITLPTSVNAQQAHATFENGLLTLTLPKTQAAPGHKIQIGQAAGMGAR